MLSSKIDTIYFMARVYSLEEHGQVILFPEFEPMLEENQELEDLQVHPSAKYVRQVPTEILSLAHIRAFHAFGYPMVYHPVTRKLCLEHRLIVERILGRALKDREVVHHKNGVPWDNNPDNLMVCPSQSEHMKLEHFLRRIKHGVMPLFENDPILEP